jgi:hypothetical protein
MSASKRFYVVLVLVMSPLIFGLLYTQHELREQRLVSVHRAAMEHASYMAGELRVMTSGMKNLLMAMSHMPAIRADRADGCSGYMAAVHKAFPDTIAIGAADLSGNVYCLSRPMERPINIGDRHHFKSALERNGFVVGQHVFSPTMKVPSLPFAYPIRDVDGRPVAVAFAVLTLSRLAEQLSSSHASHNANVVVIDRLGVIVADLPGTGRVGEALDDEWARVVTSAEPGSSEVIDPHTGKPTIAAVAPLQGDARGLTLAVRVDKETALKDIDEQARRHLGLIAAALVIALLGGWLVGGRKDAPVPSEPAGDTVSA